MILEMPDRVSDTAQNGAGSADADQAFLFAENGTSRLSITRAPMELPASIAGWTLVQSFTLGVQHVMPIDKDPEPIIRAIFSEGFYVWDSAVLPEPAGTGQ